MIEHKSATPLYMQIKQHILDEIESGTYSDGDKLPSEREMCETYHVSRIPVRKALEILEMQGIIYSVQGKGSFVRKHVINDSLVEIRSFSETLALQGYSGYTKIIDFFPCAADNSYDMMLNSTETGTSELCLLGLDTFGPIVYYTSVMPRPLAARFNDAAKDAEAAGEAFSTFDLYPRLGVAIGKVNQRVMAINASQQIANYLAIPEGTAVLMLESVILNSRMEPVEYKCGYYRTDKYSFTLHRIL